MKQHGIDDIKVTDNTRTIRIILLMQDAGKSVCQSRAVSCKACGCNKKNVTKKDRKRVTPRWIDISGPGPVRFLSSLHNPINPLNVVCKNSFS